MKSLESKFDSIDVHEMASIEIGKRVRYFGGEVPSAKSLEGRKHNSRPY